MTDAHRSKKRQLSRRAVLQGIGLGSTTLLLAACPAPAGSGAASGEAPPAEEIELDFFAWGDASDIPAWEELAATYAEQNPNVTVKPSISGTGVDYYTKLQTTFAGGVVPEIASFQGWEWQPFSDAGLLAPIDSYIERDNFTGPYPEGVDSIEFSTRRDGSRYLIPLQSGCMVMFYAKAPFDEAGVAYPTDDWTFEEFVGIAEQLTELAAAEKPAVRFLNFVHGPLQVAPSEHDPARLAGGDHLVGVGQTAGDRLVGGDSPDAGFGAGDDGLLHVFRRRNHRGDVGDDLFQQAFGVGEEGVDAEHLADAPPPFRVVLGDGDDLGVGEGVVAPGVMLPQAAAADDGGLVSAVAHGW